jgi:hypothetical protein
LLPAPTEQHLSSPRRDRRVDRGHFVARQDHDDEDDEHRRGCREHNGDIPPPATRAAHRSSVSGFVELDWNEAVVPMVACGSGHRLVGPFLFHPAAERRDELGPRFGLERIEEGPDRVVTHR